MGEDAYILGKLLWVAGNSICLVSNEITFSRNPDRTPNPVPLKEIGA
jgi:hypothetical protein